MLSIARNFEAILKKINSLDVVKWLNGNILEEAQNS